MRFIKYALLIIFATALGAAGVWVPLNKNNHAQAELLSKQADEINQLESKVAALETALKQEIDLKEREIQERDRAISQISLPDLKVKYAVRNAYLTNTKVLQLTNFANRAVRVKVIWTTASGDSNSTYILLEPNSLVEHGSREGFPYLGGDNISIEAEGYRPISFTIPR